MYHFYVSAKQLIGYGHLKQRFRRDWPPRQRRKQASQGYPVVFVWDKRRRAVEEFGRPLHHVRYIARVFSSASDAYNYE
jgi:hypothetical protein